MIARLKIIVVFIILNSSLVGQVNVNYQWARGIGGLSYDQGNSVLVDAMGNSYYTGYFSSSVDFDPGIGTALLSAAGTTDIFIAKYDVNGNYLWAKSIGGASDDKANSMAMDALGNIYITGKFSYAVDFDPGVGTAILNSSGGWGMFYAKYDANGNYLWAKNIGSTNDIDGVKIAVDIANNCIITGYKWTSMDFDPGPGTAMLNQLGQIDLYFAKFDSNGNYLWAKSIGSAGNSHACGTAITCDLSGNIYLGGYFNITTDFDPGVGTSTLSSVNGADIFFGKYDSNGNYIWAKSIGSGNDDYLKGIAVDNAGNVIITGSYRGPADFDPSAATVYLNTISVNIDDVFLAKYSSNGNYIWANSLGGVGTDWGTAIKVDGSGKIYIAGTVSGVADLDPAATSALLYSNGLMDAFFAMYDGMGNHLWSKSIGSTTSDYCAAIDVDVNGTVYITGSFSGNADFDPNGGVANINWYASDDIYIAKYSNVPLSINDIKDKEQSESIMPNPNNGVFVVNAQSESVLSVFNSIGQKVYVIDLKQGINRVEIEGLQAGIYNYLITTELLESKAGKLAIQ